MEKEIKKLINDNFFDYDVFGLRSDNYIYNIGDTCHVSHQLYQDDQTDENGNSIYPFCNDGIYKGFFDGGELPGTCALSVNDTNTEKVLQKVKIYPGNNIYLIAGNIAECGNDPGEIIIKNAVVLSKFKKII